MSADAELEVLLSLDGQSYEAAAGYVVEFIVRRTEKTKARPHGISYALVFRAKGRRAVCAVRQCARGGTTRGKIREAAGGLRPLAPDGSGSRTAVRLYHGDAASRRLLARGEARDGREGDSQ